MELITQNSNKDPRHSNRPSRVASGVIFIVLGILLFVGMVVTIFLIPEESDEALLDDIFFIIASFMFFFGFIFTALGMILVVNKKEDVIDEIRDPHDKQDKKQDI